MMRTGPGWAQRLLRSRGRPVNQGERSSWWRSSGTYRLRFRLVVSFLNRTPVASLIGRRLGGGTVRCGDSTVPVR
ncbi:hypothetical protein CesoFtcFv8_001834 [Champsocephalus esox]|uniref:Uncharacterized protein n=1 Tax=Champsocephalus esox TaxID=159716 RepID=A0AAN8D015_9TELE|nr:hypothetical protein CesoFtcFv8_001834 [Champsocephalus esox]